MKNWINRLMKGSDGSAASPATDAAAAAAASAHASAPAPADGADGADAVDAAWYRWLAGAAARDVPPDIERRVLDELHALAGTPEVAAGLVPRLPEVVPQLLRSLDDDGASIGELARQVAQDVVLVAEVIREANSAYYRPITPVRNVEAAITMLGQNGLRMLLARIAFRPIVNMEAEGFARRAAPRIWDQSVKCALAASLMAPGLSTGVFESYLAGLMQNVGLVVGLRLLHRASPDGAVPASAAFGAALLAGGRRLSAAIATHWAFPPAVGAAIEGAGQPDAPVLAQALTQGDRIAKLRMLVDAHVLDEDDALVADGLTSFQRRCLGKLANLEA